MHEFTINPALLGEQCSHKALDFVLCRMKKNESENNSEKTFVSYDSIFGLQVSLTFDVAENKLECFMQVLITQQGWINGEFMHNPPPILFQIFTTFIPKPFLEP